MELTPEQEAVVSELKKLIEVELTDFTLWENAPRTCRLLAPHSPGAALVDFYIAVDSVKKSRELNAAIAMLGLIDKSSLLHVRERNFMVKYGITEHARNVRRWAYKGFEKIALQITDATSTKNHPSAHFSVKPADDDNCSMALMYQNSVDMDEPELYVKRYDDVQRLDGADKHRVDFVFDEEINFVHYRLVWRGPFIPQFSLQVESGLAGGDLLTSFSVRGRWAYLQLARKSRVLDDIVRQGRDEA